MEVILNNQQSITFCNASSGNLPYDRSLLLPKTVACNPVSPFLKFNFQTAGKMKSSNKSTKVLYNKKIGKKVIKFKNFCCNHELVNLRNSKYICGTCGEAFDSKYILETQYLCQKSKFSRPLGICNKKLRPHGQLMMHDLNHQNKIKCIQYGKDFNRTSHIVECSAPNSEDYECGICSKKFKLLSDLVSHHNSHFMNHDESENENQTECNICKKSFICSKFLDIHYRIHTGEKSYKCKKCTETFNCKTLLKKHITIHKKRNSEKSLYTCTICMRSFSQKKSYLDHCNFHAGLTPYKCKTCGKNFSHACNLYRHRSHKQKKIYTCDICQNVYNSSSSLKRHTLNHLEVKPHKCKVCSKRFAMLSYLQRHHLSHTGEKPYVCDVCQKGFSKSYNLNIHYRIHTGEKPFICEICQKTFRVKCSMKDHLKNHHGIERLA